MSARPDAPSATGRPDAGGNFASCLLLALLMLVSLTACGRWQTYRDDYGATYLTREICPAPSGQPGGLVRMTVLEPIERAALLGVPIVVTNVHTRTTQAGSVSDKGTLSLPLPAGQYVVRVNCVGYNALTTKPLTVRPGCELRLHLYLGAEY